MKSQWMNCSKFKIIWFGTYHLIWPHYSLRGYMPDLFGVILTKYIYFFICLFLFVNKQLIFVYFFERSWVLQKNCYKIKKQVYCAISEMPSISAFKTGSLPLDVLPWVQFLNFLREIDFTKIFQNILFYFVLCLFVCL